MVFWILLGLLCLFVVLTVFACSYVSLGKCNNCDTCEGLCIFGSIAMIILSILCSTFLIGAWNAHAHDLATVSSYYHTIEVHQQRVDSLRQMFETVEYPAKPTISLDGDDPWGSIVKSLSDAEDKLAEAKTKRTKAIRSIEARKLGPMGGIVTLLGDYK